MGKLFFLRAGVFPIVILVGTLICFLPFINSVHALLLGIALSLLNKDKIEIKASDISGNLLKSSIVLMGFGMSWKSVLESSSSSFVITAAMILLTFIVGLLFSNLLKIDKRTALLISVGTAICGASAIAAISPIIGAKNEQFSFALFVIFLFNALALIFFPIIGHALDLNQVVFGNWAAIAIHDTSSVVGAGKVYGEEALQIATSVKLTRALWIVPLALLLGLFQSRTVGKVRIPWFILLFVGAMLVAYNFPQFFKAFELLYLLGKKGLVLTLFFIGITFRPERLKTIDIKYFVMGGGLWFVISLVSILALTHY